MTEVYGFPIFPGLYITGIITYYVYDIQVRDVYKFESLRKYRVLGNGDVSDGIGGRVLPNWRRYWKVRANETECPLSAGASPIEGDGDVLVRDAMGTGTGLL